VALGSFLAFISSRYSLKRETASSLSPDWVRRGEGGRRRGEGRVQGGDVGGREGERGKMEGPILVTGIFVQRGLREEQEDGGMREDEGGWGGWRGDGEDQREDGGRMEGGWREDGGWRENGGSIPCTNRLLAQDSMELIQSRVRGKYL
jgi:hypothetical protein